MANVDGEWDVEIRTPMGLQAALLVMRSDGARVSGSVTGELGSMEFDDGALDGDSLSWSMTISKPFAMTLAGRATVAGDTIQGTVDAGVMGAMPLSGTRRT